MHYSIGLLDCKLFIWILVSFVPVTKTGIKNGDVNSFRVTLGMTFSSLRRRRMPSKSG